MTSTISPEDLHPGDMPPEDEERLFTDEDFPQPEPQFSFLGEKLPAFAKLTNTGEAKEYERKIGGLLNALFENTVGNASTLPDAAALLAYGDKVAKTGGALAAVDPKVAKGIDFIAIPANPYLMFAMSVIPLAAQLLRNHEDQISNAGSRFRIRRNQRKNTPKAPKAKVYVTVPGINRKIRVPFRVKLSLKLLTGTSVPPEVLASTVFSNPDVQKQLLKRGIKIG